MRCSLRQRVAGTGDAPSTSILPQMSHTHLQITVELHFSGFTGTASHPDMTGRKEEKKNLDNWIFL
jgi:hypothetical protein